MTMSETDWGIVLVVVSGELLLAIEHDGAAETMMLKACIGRHGTVLSLLIVLLPVKVLQEEFKHVYPI